LQYDVLVLQEVLERREAAQTPSPLCLEPLSSNSSRIMTSRSPASPELEAGPIVATILVL